MKFIVRPYYRYDCDSESGFNNGHYLDPMEVEAESEDDAAETALLKFKRENTQVAVWYNDDAVDGLGDFTIAWIVAYNDGDGNEISRAEFESLNENDEIGGYSYRYIDFSADVSEATGDALKGGDK